MAIFHNNKHVRVKHQDLWNPEGVMNIQSRSRDGNYAVEAYLLDQLWCSVSGRQKRCEELLLDRQHLPVQSAVCRRKTDTQRRTLQWVSFTVTFLSPQTDISEVEPTKGPPSSAG